MGISNFKEFFHLLQGGSGCPRVGIGSGPAQLGGLVLWGGIVHLRHHKQFSAWAQAQWCVQRCELDLPLRGLVLTKTLLFCPWLSSWAPLVSLRTTASVLSLPAPSLNFFLASSFNFTLMSLLIRTLGLAKASITLLTTRSEMGSMTSPMRPFSSR